MSSEFGTAGQVRSQGLPFYRVRLGRMLQKSHAGLCWAVMRDVEFPYTPLFVRN